MEQDSDIFAGRRPAEVIPPCDLIAQEMVARRWNCNHLRRKTGMSNSMAQYIVDGKIPITPQVAALLAQAFGASAETWLNLQARWDAWWPGELPTEPQESAKPGSRSRSIPL